MKDLYKQLGVDETSGGEQIRAALAAAAPEVREAAELILLDPARRSVYDRNRQVLLTVGRLRAHLGLNLTRFWPRSRFGDFTISLSPVAGAGAGAGGASPIDPMRIASAFGVAVGRGGGSRRPARRTIFIAAAVAFAAAVAPALWYWFKSR